MKLDNNKKYDLVGIGNSIVDILAYKDKSFIEDNDMNLGTMSLVDHDQIDNLYKKLGAATECSGGSAANTLAGFSLLGGKSSFIGKVKIDQAGDIFHKSLTKAGVEYQVKPAIDGDPTGKCIVVVTEEKGQFGGPVNVERTMATYLGASITISEDDIKESLISDAKVIYFEGYLWDSPTGKAAIVKAIEIAKKNNVKVAFSLSDPFCVERYRDDFRKLINEDVNLLFANEAEITSLYNEPEIRKNLFRLTGKCEMSAITQGAEGSYIITEDKIYTIDPIRVENVYDVTGAGDLYAAGFLFGIVNNYSPEKCGQLGSLCAAEIIQYLGARPVTDLKELIKKLEL